MCKLGKYDLAPSLLILGICVGSNINTILSGQSCYLGYFFPALSSHKTLASDKWKLGIICQSECFQQHYIYLQLLYFEMVLIGNYHKHQLSLILYK